MCMVRVPLESIAITTNIPEKERIYSMVVRIVDKHRSALQLDNTDNSPLASLAFLMSSKWTLPLLIINGTMIAHATKVQNWPLTCAIDSAIYAISNWCY